MATGGGGRSEVYEMLWDCDYCGTRKLLGKSHRHCPKCGAPQDPARRYFPAQPDRVAVEDHVYHGADRVCEACDSANSAAAGFCSNCGAPMEGASEVARVDRPAPAPSAARSAVAPQGRRGVVARGCGCLAAGAALLAALAASFCFTRSETLTVAGHSWERSIAVERFQAARDSAWCDALPGEAYRVSRTQKARGRLRVPDGESCHFVDVDDGDGTFTQQERCQPRYRSETEYDDFCEFIVNRWVSAGRLVERGADAAPRWPVSGIRACADLGCQREGRRSERYVLELADTSGERHRCTVPESRWGAFAPGSRLRADVRVVTGGIVCDSLAER